MLEILLLVLLVQLGGQAVGGAVGVGLVQQRLSVQHQSCGVGTINSSIGYLFSTTTPLNATYRRPSTINSPMAKADDDHNATTEGIDGAVHGKG